MLGFRRLASRILEGGTLFREARKKLAERTPADYLCMSLFYNGIFHVYELHIQTYLQKLIVLSILDLVAPSSHGYFKGLSLHEQIGEAPR